MLRLGGAEVKIGYLELLDNNIGPRGAIALGEALTKNNNLSLLTLKLDFNLTLGAEGISNLCRGLRTNGTLKQLHLAYCQLPAEAGAPLADLLANARTSLEIMNLTGNRLGGLGLSALCKGLMLNDKLTELILSDNAIDQLDDDLTALTDFRDCLLRENIGLTSVDLRFNRIGENGAEILVPALSEMNKKIEKFYVDLTLPMHLFEKVFRDNAGKKGKKGKKKK